MATSRAHKTISAADVSKALENLNFPALDEYTEQFQNELEGLLFCCFGYESYFSSFSIIVFRQGMKHEKGKNKPPESKGKSKEKDSSSKTAASASHSHADPVADNAVVSETVVGSSLDVEMHDATQ